MIMNAFVTVLGITALSDVQALSCPNRRAFLNTVSSSTVGAILTCGPSIANSKDIVIGGTMIFGDYDIMSPKARGTSEVSVQEDLRFGASRKLADKICNYNSHFAELGGYFRETSFEDDVRDSNGPITFYDSNSGKPLFQAPIGRSKEDFIADSKVHGWPSFRDEETVWDNVRVLRGSLETVSVDGTRLGHNLPDRNGNRYCINLVSIAGNPNTQEIIG